FGWHLVRLRRLLPTAVGVVGRYCRRQPGGVRPQILLHDDALLIDDKRHYPGGSIVGRIGPEGKTPRHPAIAHVARRSTSRGLSLGLQHGIGIAVKWDRLARLPFSVSFRSGLGDPRPDWTLRRAICR